jgi:hypothetical protein
MKNYVICLSLLLYLFSVLIQWNFNSLNHSGNYLWHQLLDSVTLHFPHRLLLRIFYDSRNEHRFFPYTGLSFLMEMACVLCEYVVQFYV